ncbi:CBR-NURF-1 protein, variant [Aphelenchoides besseyi]|nr:CBR-NURF-1 protein, variant [Aphelenchoides besseyi]
MQMMKTQKPRCLHLDGPLIIDALNVYETCLTFSQDLRLSTFVFEDFANALLTPENSRLLCEIHLSLLRFVLQDEENQGTTFGNKDTTRFFYTLIQLLDDLTYGEVLRFYAESDLDDRLAASHVVRILKKNYPFVDGTDRLIVLSWLCSQFAKTAKYKNVCVSTQKFSPMKSFNCEICSKGGQMVVCDICDGCFHLRCVKLQSLPKGEWFCSSCSLRAKQLGFDFEELTADNLKQDRNIKQLGHDDDGRFFWLMNNWILAYDPLKKILYLHGSLTQVQSLLRELDADFMEYELSARIGEYLDHLFEQLDFILCNTMTVEDEETLNKATAKLLDQIVESLGSEESRLMHSLWSAKLKSKFSI